MIIDSNLSMIIVDAVSSSLRIIQQSLKCNAMIILQIISNRLESISSYKILMFLLFFNLYRKHLIFCNHLYFHWFSRFFYVLFVLTVFDEFAAELLLFLCTFFLLIHQFYVYQVSLFYIFFFNMIILFFLRSIFFFSVIYDHLLLLIY